MNTPETNKAERMAWAGEYMVPTEVARKLERERDEARKERDQLKEALLIMEALLTPGIDLFPEIGEILKRGAAK